MMNEVITRREAKLKIPVRGDGSGRGAWDPVVGNVGVGSGSGSLREMMGGGNGGRCSKSGSIMTSMCSEYSRAATASEEAETGLR